MFNRSIDRQVVCLSGASSAADGPRPYGHAGGATARDGPKKRVTGWWRKMARRTGAVLRRAATPASRSRAMAEANGHASAPPESGGERGSGGAGAAADVEQPADAGALSIEPEKPEFGVPEMTYWQLFKLFLRFGCLAVGGPVRGDATQRVQGSARPRWADPPAVARVAGAADCDDQGGAGDAGQVDFAAGVQQGASSPHAQPAT